MGEGQSFFWIGAGFEANQSQEGFKWNGFLRYDGWAAESSISESQNCSSDEFGEADLSILLTPGVMPFVNGKFTNIFLKKKKLIYSNSILYHVKQQLPSSLHYCWLLPFFKSNAVIDTLELPILKNMIPKSPLRNDLKHCRPLLSLHRLWKRLEETSWTPGLTGSMQCPRYQLDKMFLALGQRKRRQQNLRSS